MLGHLWVVATVNHHMSIEGASYLWKLTFQWMERIFKAKEREGNRKRFPQFPHLRRKILKKSTPNVKIQLGYRDIENGNTHITEPSFVAPKKIYSDVTKFKKLFEISSIPLLDVFKIHSSICDSHQKYENGRMEVILSCDGVADAKSNTVSMDIFSVAFPECSNVYPIVAIRSEEKGNVNLIAELTKITDELKLLNVKIKCVLCDNPMRAILRNAKNHSAYFACEYCTSHAVPYRDPQIEKDIDKEKREHEARKDRYEEERQRLMNLPGTSSNSLLDLLEERIESNDRQLDTVLRKTKKVSNIFSLAN